MSKLLSRYSAMLFSRNSDATPRSFSAPAGERIYAIGDVHGRDDLLARLLDRIDEDNAGRSSASTRLIFLGDLVDRGPDSAAVVRRVRRLMEASDAVSLIMGNHEEVFVRAARGDAKSARSLLSIGGYPTLESYGISREEADAGTFDDLAHLLLDRIPREDVDLLASAKNWVQAGDYLFVHAGVRPGRPLPRQRTQDLRWIREPFLSATRDDGMMVIHGHTPRREVDEAADRIGIDTGAFMSGVLTAVGVEGTDRWFLSAEGAEGTRR